MKKEFERCLSALFGGMAGGFMMTVGFVTMIIGFVWAAGGYIDNFHIGDYFRKED